MTKTQEEVSYFVTHTLYFNKLIQEISFNPVQTLPKLLPQCEDEVKWTLDEGPGLNRYVLLFDVVLNQENHHDFYMDKSNRNSF